MNLDHAAFAVASHQADPRALLEECVRLGVRPAGINPVYEALANEAIAPLTVPAFNVRGLTYDTARAIFRRALASDTFALMFELAPSEARTGNQSFLEYAALVCAAAAREGHRGPVFLQGDHFALEEDSDVARTELVELGAGVLRAGYRQIDLDVAALTAEGATAEERQVPNARNTAWLLQQLAADAGPGTIFGGETGEIGGENTSPEDLEAFITLVRREAGEAARLFGKVSVQTGTAHGGMTGGDGRHVRMPLDLGLARQLADVARAAGFGGIVQHGASTLEADQFAALPDAGIIEVHLATNLQNLVFDSPHFPPELRERMRDDALASSVGAAERGAETGATDPETAFRQKRWSMWGPYKQELLSLSAETRHELAEGVADWAAELFSSFRLGGRTPELRKLYSGQ